MEGAHHRGKIVNEAAIRHKIPFQPEYICNQAVKPHRAKGGQRFAHDLKMGLFLPSPPDHTQMGMGQFMGHKAKDLFRVKLLEVKPVGGSRIGGGKQGQKMLPDFYGQITCIFFIQGRKP